MRIPSRFVVIQQAVMLLAIGISVGITFYWATTYSGLHRYFSQLQLRLFGSEHDMISLGASYLGVAVPCILLAVYVYRAVDPRQVVPKNEPILLLGHRADVVAKRVVPGAWAVLPYLFIAVGVFLFARAQLEGDRAVIEADELSLATSIETRWVEIQGGTMHLDAASVVVNSASTEFYFPVTCASASVAIFVEVDYQQLQSLRQQNRPTDSIVGILQANGLPGPVRESYRQGANLAPQHWLLDYGASPDSEKKTGLIMSLLGLVVVAWRFFR